MTLVWGLFGWLVGMGLNLIIHGLPHSQRAAFPPRCPGCGERVPWSSMSALWRGLARAGRCPDCGVATPGWHVSADVAAALLFAGLYLRYGLSPELLAYSLYGSILLLVMAIDLGHRYVYSLIVYPGVLLGLALGPLALGIPWWGPLAGLLAGGGLFGALYGLGRVIFRQEALGVGDILIAGLLGAMLGFPAVLTALVYGVLAGGVASLVLLLSRLKSRGEFFPYGAALCAGGILSLFGLVQR